MNPPTISCSMATQLRFIFQGTNKLIEPTMKAIVLRATRLFAILSAFTMSVRLIHQSCSDVLYHSVRKAQLDSKQSAAQPQRTSTLPEDRRVFVPINASIQGVTSTSSKLVVPQHTIAINQSSPSSPSSPSSSSSSSTSSTSPSPRTLAYFDGHFYSGFRNEGMVFTMFVMYARQHNFSQILIDSINWKDLWLFGHAKESAGSKVPHAVLFDVEHWNSHYPALPKLVPYNETEHYEFDPKRPGFRNRLIAEVNATHPYAYGRQGVLTGDYKQYTKRVVNDVNASRDPAEVLMLQGAFRPSPELQSHIDRLHHGEPYLSLHTRVEPDMQHHDVPRCKHHKVYRLKEIVESLEKLFPEPPVKKVHISVFRALLEREIIDFPNNTVAAENLDELNRITRDGLWNGTVPVFEAGTDYILKTNSTFTQFASITGAVVNYFLSIQSQIFVGTEVSSSSLDVIQTRFFRKNRQNYFYNPNGLHVATPLEARMPPRFAC